MTDKIPYNNIRRGIIKVANHINAHYGKRPILAVCVLKGAVHFFSDLVLMLDMPVEYAFLQVQTYNGKEANSKLLFDYNADFSGKNVLIVEDILDTGCTIEYLKEYLTGKGAKSIATTALFYKKGQKAEFLGLEVPTDKWLVGFGLDISQQNRNKKDVLFV